MSAVFINWIKEIIISCEKKLKVTGSENCRTKKKRNNIKVYKGIWNYKKNMCINITCKIGVKFCCKTFYFKDVLFRK